MSNRDYTWYSFGITFIVLVFLVAISFIPPFQVGDVTTRRANIFSELYDFDDSEYYAAVHDPKLDIEFIEEAKNLPDEIPEPEQEHNTVAGAWEMGGEVPSGVLNDPDNPLIIPAEVSDTASVVIFEDYGADEHLTVAALSARMEALAAKRVVRIAFLGDSFIEGDIMTADVREQMQTIFGGGGVGFLPFAYTLAPNKPTAKHTFNGWTNYNLVQKRAAPERWRENFFVSGYISVPTGNAWVKYAPATFRKHLASVYGANIIFRSGAANTLEVTVNDTMRRTFEVEGADAVQQIRISGGRINSLRIDVRNPQEFIGYGVAFDGARGVAVDNFALRSNSGLALFGTNGTVNRRIGQLLGGYDMIVLQYGLNAMDPNNTNYKSYGEQLRKVINYMRSCFPESVIVLMGVGDRSRQSQGTFVTMPAVKAMLAEQRAAAIECGVGFWDTFEAMGGQNSMADFIRKGWAAKDYTHLSYRGGKAIADQFVRAFIYARLQAGNMPVADDGPNGYWPLEGGLFDIGNDTIAEPTDDRVPDTIPDSLDRPVPVPAEVGDTVPVEVPEMPADSLTVEETPEPQIKESERPSAPIQPEENEYRE